MQDIVKALFSDPEINSTHRLAAVNSINWARILAQITYYFHSYFNIVKREMIDMVPKAISLTLVTHSKDNLQRELLQELYKPEVLDDAQPLDEPTGDVVIGDVLGEEEAKMDVDTAGELRLGEEAPAPVE